jgi:hypothetical protein
MMATGDTIAEMLERRGELRGARNSFRIVWEARFGPVPKTLHDHVNVTTDVERLTQAMLRILRLDQPDESILDPTP